MKSKILQKLGDCKVWPIPVRELGHVSWRLRYDKAGRDELYHEEDCLIGASTLDAYEFLIKMPQPRRNKIIAMIREAMAINSA